MSIRQDIQEAYWLYNQITINSDSSIPSGIWTIIKEYACTISITSDEFIYDDQSGKYVWENEHLRRILSEEDFKVLKRVPFQGMNVRCKLCKDNKTLYAIRYLIHFGNESKLPRVINLCNICINLFPSNYFMRVYLGAFNWSYFDVIPMFLCAKITKGDKKYTIHTNQVHDLIISIE